jgi:pyruvate-formate lyase
VLELALTSGRSLLSGAQLGPETKPLSAMESFDEVIEAFFTQLGVAREKLARLVNHTDASHSANRRYPLMSVLMEDCIGRGRDVCAGGARYNLTGCIIAGLPNVVNSLTALRERIFDQDCCTPAELLEALQRNFEGEEALRRLLLSAPKWGNGEADTDELARLVTDRLYEEYKGLVNARGGRWQLALYSFMANWGLGEVCAASADGRPAREHLTRNLNPTWGTDLSGPTAVLNSLSAIDFTQFPDGSALDLRFDPRLFETEAARQSFVGFLKAFVDLGVMEMQLSFADADTLRAAREHPEQHQHVMVRVAGYSARFIDLEAREQEEVINRTEQGWG